MKVRKRVPIRVFEAEVGGKKILSYGNDEQVRSAGEEPLGTT